MDNQILAHTKYNCTWRDIVHSMQNHGSRIDKRWSMSKPCTSVCVDSAQNEYFRSDVKTERKESPDDIRPTSEVQRQVWQTFLGKRILC